MNADPFVALESELPSFITRTQVAEKLGGWIAVGTLANLDSEGRGPAGRVIMGRKVAYPRAELIAWLRQRATFAGSVKHD
jgi:predicted DNA-binding transcriptional regulator AlpA